MKSSKGKGIAEGDSFSVNFGFTSKLRRVKIPLVSMKDVNASGAKVSGSAQGENFDQLPASVLEDRRHIIEAAIVRIMKARKVLSHNDLIAEVLRQISHRFSVEVPALKKRIEALIDREYIMRDPEDRRTYKYLA
jgi:cullin 3